MRFHKLVLLALVLPALGGAGPARPTAPKSLAWPGPEKRIILVDPDVELDELTAGGVAEPRADWTRTAKDFLRTDIAQSLSNKGVTAAPTPEISDPQEARLVRLNSQVGRALLMHYTLNLYLAGKSSLTDWTLGPGVAALHDHYGGDYALFVFIRDSYSSDSRKAMMLGAAMLGIGIPGGQQTGFATLVDLHTGQIMWYNTLLSAFGDLRTAKPAQSTVNDLLKDLPL